MLNKEKITKIEALTSEKLISLMTNLIKVLGYDNVIVDSNTIAASKSSPLSLDRFLFVFPEQRLSGNVNVDEIAKSVTHYKERVNADIVYIVSRESISGGFQTAISRKINNLNFIGRDNLISIINENYTDFWKHKDLKLIEYEKYFCENLAMDSELKKLKIFNDKYQKLLDIYIEPRITHFYEEKSTQTPVRKRVVMNDILNLKTSVILSGDPGSGKSTFLKKIGEKLIEYNLKRDKSVRNIPIYITSMELYEGFFLLEDIILNRLKPFFEYERLSEISDQYNIYLLIDSIDEFIEKEKKDLLQKMNEISSRNNIKYIISTRNSDKMQSLMDTPLDSYHIERFNTAQIEKFISNFFLDEKGKTESLLEALRENRIIERLPITPLTLSLISILYEENNLEIPATIADIYDNFNSLIIGRLTVSSRVEFVDISFKERILSLYALHLLEKENHTSLTKEEFYSFFEDYFAGKTLPVKRGSLEEVLEYLIDNTGVLILKDNKWVQFSHDSYLEYYAAVEIFKHRRDKENLLIENFFDFKWQNSAIFYAGKSKDMPVFLEEIVSKLKNANALNDFMSGVLGTGYLLQALYQTDNKLRAEAILEAIELNTKSTNTLIKLAADDVYLFRNYSIPILQIMNLLFFYENFNSITIKEPLKIAFYDLFKQYEETRLPIYALKAINIALILDSKRISYAGALEKIIEDKKILREPTLYSILDFFFEIIGERKYLKLKEEIRTNYFPKIARPVQDLVKLPAGRVRFTNLDTIQSHKKVQLIVEGKTDAEILEHAFFVLTNGQTPYWNIRPSGSSSGGAPEVSKFLLSCKPIVDSEDIIIGVFDHDSKGLSEFRRLSNNVFCNEQNKILRKHKEKEIYALLLPVPGEMDHYLKKDQVFNFFTLEHYFGEEFLNNHKMLEKTDIPDVFKIKKSKTQFSKLIRGITDPKVFVYFTDLFLQIDRISQVKIDYNVD